MDSQTTTVNELGISLSDNRSLTAAVNTFSNCQADNRSPSQRLSTGQIGQSLTVADAGKGLSRLQRRILGVAYDVNLRLHGGRAYPIGERLAAVDFSTPLGVYALYRIAPRHCAQQPPERAAQAAISRALRRLKQRGLMRYYRPPQSRGLDPRPHVCGYVLTDAGLSIGSANVVEIPEAQRAIRYFHLQHACGWDEEDHKRLAAALRPGEREAQA